MNAPKYYIMKDKALRDCSTKYLSAKLTMARSSVSSHLSFFARRRERRFKVRDLPPRESADSGTRFGDGRYRLNRSRRRDRYFFGRREEQQNSRTSIEKSWTEDVVCEWSGRWSGRWVLVRNLLKSSSVKLSSEHVDEDEQPLDEISSSSSLSLVLPEWFMSANEAVGKSARRCDVNDSTVWSLTRLDEHRAEQSFSFEHCFVPSEDVDAIE